MLVSQYVNASCEYAFEDAVAVSSFGTLLYYSIKNLSALRLHGNQRVFPKGLSVAGLVGCLALAFMLALQSVGHRPCNLGQWDYPPECAA